MNPGKERSARGTPETLMTGMLECVTQPALVSHRAFVSVSLPTISSFELGGIGELGGFSRGKGGTGFFSLSLPRYLFVCVCVYLFVCVCLYFHVRELVRERSCKHFDYSAGQDVSEGNGYGTVFYELVMQNH